MRRAIPLMILGLCALLLLPLPRRAAPQTANTIDGIGLVDYTKRPDFTVGSWAQYRVTGQSAMGLSDDYVVTLLIGGEERFWGEDGFWIETWTDRKGRPPSAVASLMSYAIFDDSSAVQNLQYYARKLVTDTDLEGNAIQDIRIRPRDVLRQRREGGVFTTAIQWHRDTLGPDTVMVPRGNFDVVKVRLRFGARGTSEMGDSTQENEVEEHRTIYMTRNIPITSMVREDIEKWIRRRTWKAGQSQNAPLIVREHSEGSARLLDYGVGLKPRMVPAEYRRPLKRQDTAPVAAPKRGRGSATRRSG
jgi:hypothetical protein